MEKNLKNLLLFDYIIDSNQILIIEFLIFFIRCRLQATAVVKSRVSHPLKKSQDLNLIQARREAVKRKDKKEVIANRFKIMIKVQDKIEVKTLE